MTYDKEQQMRAEMIVVLRTLQIVALVLVSTAIITFIFPWGNYALIIGGTLLLWYEWKIEARIKKKMREEEEYNKRKENEESTNISN